MKTVKICGLQDEAMIDVAINANAGHVGFVHFSKSPRHLELPILEELTSYVGDRAMSWVVLAKPSVELLLEIAKKVSSVSGLQIHGEVTVDTMKQVRAVRPDMKFMRAYSVSEKSDLPSRDEMTQFDFVLFDAKPKPDDKLPGGNGTSFNWQIMRGFDVPVPWFLAGGLNSSNVAEAILQSGTQMVDVSSGIENSPGVKDPERILSFLAAAISI